MKTNWFMVISLILLGVIIGVTVSTLFLNQPTPQNAQPICSAWLKSLIDAGYVKIIQP